MSYLDLLIDISNGDLVCLILDKRDALDFHIVNFSDLPGNIPTSSAYDTYISQLIRYSRTFHNYDSFSSRNSVTFQFGHFFAKSDENILQINGQISRTCIKVQQESIINDSVPMAQL